MTQLITTVEELNKHVGEYIVCFYYKDYTKEYNDNFLRPYDEDNIKFMWMFKLTRKVDATSNNSIRHTDLYGNNFVCLMDDNKHRDKKTPFLIKGEGSSNAQSYAKLPTKEELNKYRNVIRHIRIFGK
jgi:hypothetical protein